MRRLSADLSADRDVVRNLRRDMKVLRSLRHTNLVSVVDFDLGQPATVSYEAVRGTTLAHLLAVGGPLELNAAMVMYDDCLAALQALHAASVVHGNVAPAAFAIETAGAVMLRDAGIPRPPSDVTSSGTPSDPASPAARPRSVVDDLYAAAAVFYEAVTGRSPNVTSVAPTRGERGKGRSKSMWASVPVGARRLLQRGLDKDVAARWPSAAETRRDLAGAAGSFLGTGWRRSGRAWLAAASTARAHDRLPDGEALMTVVPAGAGGLPPALRRWDRGTDLAGWRLLAAGAAGVVALIAAVVLLRGSPAKTPAPKLAGLPPVALSTPTDVPTLWPPTSAPAPPPGSVAAAVTPDPEVVGPGGGGFYAAPPAFTTRPPSVRPPTPLPTSPPGPTPPPTATPVPTPTPTVPPTPTPTKTPRPTSPPPTPTGLPSPSFAPPGAPSSAATAEQGPSATYDAPAVHAW